MIKSQKNTLHFLLLNVINKALQEKLFKFADG